MPHIRPRGWTPPAPRAGEGDPTAAPRVIELNGTGPEDVVIDHNGAVLTGVDDGRILRVTRHGDHIDTIADTTGRPLGLELLPDGTLLVCDAHRGLLRVDQRTGRIDVLVSQATHDLAVCNNAAVAADGTVYFSDSSQRFPLAQWRADLMEHSGTGRLLRRDPSGEVEVLLDGLYFANGVALAADETFVVVAETGAYRLTRLWLSGPRSGTSEPFVEALPGFPDNLSTAPDGTIWISQASPRDRLLDWSHAHAPWLLTAAARLPTSWQPQPRPIVWVLAVDTHGRVLRDLRTRHPRFHMVTGVREHDGTLYLGSLIGRRLAMLPLPR